jgi:N-acetyl-beta-hexosaminidase
MIRRAAIAAAIALSQAAALAASPDEASPRLVPRPALLERHAGAFRLSAATPVVVAPGDAAAKTAAAVLVERLARSRGLRLATVEGAPRDGAIVIARDGGAPAPETDESYRLEVGLRRVTLTAATLGGLDHAATTLWQLAGTGKSPSVAIPALRIEDAPRFRWRGLLLDSARHYQSPAFILRFLDAMAAQKLNVLHWHLTDDQAWRLEIRKYPRLTSVGAWRVPAGRAARRDADPATGKPRVQGGFYTRDEARAIVAYAAARGITIVPEIEMPGHASAALVAYPQFAATDRPPAAVPSDWGVYPNVYNLDAATLAFLDDVLAEVMDIFPGKFIHVGGDEVDTSQWRESARVQARMRELGIPDVAQIQHWLTRRMARLLEAHGRRLVGWDEIVEPELPASAVVMSWRGTAGALAAAARGHDSVLAVDPTLYFDHRQATSAGEPPGRASVISLADVYAFDPMPPQVPQSQRGHVLGLQGNLWTEHVRTERRAGWMAFPRAAAIAELGWSPAALHDWSDFRRRVAAMPAFYEALGMSYAKSAFAAPPPAPSGALRASRELELCTEKIALLLEDDAPLHGPRATFLVDIMNPCWIFRGAQLDRVRAIEARVGQVPFNFQVGDDAAKIRFPRPRTPEGELEVRIDGCEGELLARIPLAAAAGSEAVSTLPAARIAPREGRHDLCLRFAQPGLDPLWVLDSVRLVGPAR